MRGTGDVSAAAPRGASQLALLRQRRFAPFFWTQFLGAANDNLFKFAVTVWITYQQPVAWLPPALAGLVIGAVFILPFVLLSASAGQLCDRHDKAWMMRRVKTLEVLIMALAVWGWAGGGAGVLLACVGLMGVHSTLFGPVKYAYLPQHLDERELTGGNGLVEMGTFVAILLGSLVGGALVAGTQGHWAVAVTCLGVALAGRLAAAFLPRTPAADPALRLNWNPLSETWRNLRLAAQDRLVLRTLLGISWMWAYGGVFLAQFPVFARDVLRGDQDVAALLLVVFSLGVAAGSLACERLSRRHVEIGLVLPGALAMSVFALDLWQATAALGAAGPALQGLGGFLAQPAHWRVMADLVLLSLGAGLYSVPMYALVQWRTPPACRARIIAANNILNALAMIASALGAGALLSAGLSLPQVFGVLGLLNALALAALLVSAPAYAWRGLVLLLGRTLWRVRVHGDAVLHDGGAAILVGCHSGGWPAADVLRLALVTPRPLCALVDAAAVQGRLQQALLRLAGARLLPAPGQDPAAHEAAWAQAARVLAEGGLVLLFPEGEEGARAPLRRFRGDVMRLLERRPAPVLPFALVRRQGWGAAGLVLGEALMPLQVSPELLRLRVAALLHPAYALTYRRAPG